MIKSVNNIVSMIMIFVMITTSVRILVDNALPIPQDRIVMTQPMSRQVFIPTIIPAHTAQTLSPLTNKCTQILSNKVSKSC